MTDTFGFASRATFLFLLHFDVVCDLFKGTKSRFCACVRVWFLNRRLRIQRCGNWYRAFTNPFASSSINFGFALKPLRIKDQWYTVLVKCQFVCNRDVSVLTSMPFDGTSSGGTYYGAGRRRLSPGSFQKGLENRERTLIFNRLLLKQENYTRSFKARMN